MKKKISMHFLITTAIAIILTAVLTAIVFYRIFRAEVIDDLKNYTHVLKSVLSDGNYSEMDDLMSENIRVTIVDKDGIVIYDNMADVTGMDNHGSRPEIEDAKESGEGSIVRKSGTMDKNTFYYALLLDDGMVIRVSKETSSIWSVFVSAFPLIILTACLAFAICIILTHFLTKSLVKPIEEVARNLDHPESVIFYKEMQPFVKTIKEQHDDILKSAMMRQEFTANVSHELKTPLTSISGYSELIENGMAKGDDVVRFAGEIHQSASRLLVLINDILKLSQLDAGEQIIDFEKVDLYEIAENCINMLELHAAEHQVEFHLEGGQTMVNGDKSMLEEMIYNLCDNAIRYSVPEGNVWVVADPKEHSILVSDDGIGISEENQKRVFERFYRVDKSRSKATGGTGLGLAIVKHIVEQHGAVIELTSAVNVGTTIKITFSDK